MEMEGSQNTSIFLLHLSKLHRIRVSLQTREIYRASAGGEQPAARIEHLAAIFN